MIYVDTSVALAQLLAKDRKPLPALWKQPLIASRLLEYEVWTRLNARSLQTSHGESARLLIGRLALIELAPTILERALDPFPMPVRPLDALHLASIEFLRNMGQKIELASFDQRMNGVAATMKIPLFDL